VDGAAAFVIIAAVFLVAGFIKGALGIGLPTVVVGLLSLAMPPAQAAMLMVVPALVTNVWQIAAGPALGALLRRFAWLIVAVFVGTFSTVQLLTRTTALAGAALGAVLAAYGAYSLFGRRFEIARASERWLAPAVGFVSGALCGATGVFIIPGAPYLTSLRMNAEELVQSIGILAFVCPLALALALAAHGQYRTDMAGGSFLALFPALAGMWAGMRLRRRLPAATFMRWFFTGLVALGGYMLARSLGLA
jgi:uncharacterized membrane protein YfcA